MIERKTVVDTIEIHRDGSVGVRLGLLLVEDGVEVDTKWHRTMIVGGVTVDQQMAAVNEHLVQMGLQPVTAAEVGFIRQMKQSNDASLPSRPKFARPGNPNEGV